jgi:hypothetical protein
VGNEGVTGLALFFGDASEPSDSMIQVPGKGRLLLAAVFQRELARHGALYRLVAHYAHAPTVQRRQLEAGACECYGIVSNYFNEFLSHLPR